MSRRIGVAVVLVVLAVAVALRAYGHTGSKPVAWRDVTASSHDLFTHSAAFDVVKEGSRERVLISPGPRSSTGYGVRIVSVVEQRKRILVQVRELTPHLGRRVVARVTYPFRVIEIPRTRKHVTVHWLGH